MKRDILNRGDIELVVTQFYEKVRAEPIINSFFTEVVQVDWDKHNALMCDFWENILFYTGDYGGNPLETHKRINAIRKTEDTHFRKWESLFFDTVDSLFEGANCQKIKLHARGIAGIMQQKI
ncbi:MULTISPECIES: group III truncated hemoglobin [Sphingobacterium]|uniref:group III truncated hemoglobin n=1 Tax=Sphingobacterium TaxID=28453 RepID=UPI0013DAC820|nr:MULTISPECIES: group III truncated hemoglobin [unclassified Sphingobacterium]